MTQVSKIYDGYATCPVDRVAARVLFNFGWFAALPDGISAEVRKAVLEERIPAEQITVDYFKPPHMDGCSVNKRDMRGYQVIVYKGRKKVVCIVTGFSHIKEKVVNVSPSSARTSSQPKWWNSSHSAWRPYPGKKTISRTAMWWVMTDLGFELMTAKAIDKNMVRNVE